MRVLRKPLRTPHGLDYARYHAHLVGDIVLVVAQMLKRLAGELAPLHGRNDVAGVKKFQQNRNISPLTGFVGPKTLSELNKKLTDAQPAILVEKSSILRQIQEIIGKISALKAQLSLMK